MLGLLWREAPSRSPVHPFLATDPTRGFSKSWYNSDMEKLKEVHVSRDEKEAMLSEAMGQWWLGAIGTMMKTMGPEATMKAYGPTMRQIGRDRASRFIKEKGYKGHDVMATASVIRIWEKMMGIEGQFLEASTGRVVFRNTKCPLSGTVPQARPSLEYAM